ncbi:MAG TPA: hypothetical protein VHN37_01185 [Actinomycetota bacterium]|nr:hypothetical protein [Actinomycetota bacterium]
MRRAFLFAVVSMALCVPVASIAQEPACSWSTDADTIRRAILFGVDAVDAANVWAVGSVANDRGRERTLVRHWDGAEWTTHPSPNVKDQSNRLNDVVALPDGTAWAVGGRSRLKLKTIVQRYDGTRWRMQRSLNPSQELNSLEAVDVTPSGDVYAVGSRWNAKREYRTMIHRFDGEAWTLVPSRIPGLFYDVEAIADDDIWAVGTHSVGRRSQVLVVHYDGESWTQSTSLPPMNARFSVLYAVSGSGPDDVWAVGQYIAEGSTRPLVLHYDGAEWSFGHLPDLGSSDIVLRDVSAPSPDFAVAVGQRTYEYQEDSRVVLEWDGSAWSDAARDDDFISNWLEAADVAPDRTAWAVGYHSTHPQTSYALRRTCT